MAILTEADIAIYAPTVTDTGDVLAARILYIQSIMESAQGANRPLELTKFTEIVRINKKIQTTYPRYFPIAESPALTVEVRVANQLNYFDRPSGVDGWTLLDSSAYNLNENGRIDIDFIDSAFQGRSSFRYNNNEARLTYTAGFDFTQSTPEINALKAIAGQLLTYQQSGSFEGVRRHRIDKEVEVEWFGSAGSGYGNFPPALLSPLFKYRPRSFF